MWFTTYYLGEISRSKFFYICISFFRLLLTLLVKSLGVNLIFVSVVIYFLELVPVSLKFIIRLTN